jgi:hypothetical protein
LIFASRIVFSATLHGAIDVAGIAAMIATIAIPAPTWDRAGTAAFRLEVVLRGAASRPKLDVEAIIRWRKAKSASFLSCQAASPALSKMADQQL